MPHSVQIVLVLSAPNTKKSGDTLFLFMRQNNVLWLPTKDLPHDQSLLDCAGSLLYEASGLESRWVQLTQCPVSKVGIQIIIPFGCLISESVKAMEGTIWLTLTELAERQPERLEFLTTVCSYLVGYGVSL